MPVINLLEELPLNNYLKGLVYDGSTPTIIRVTDVNIARQNKDAIARNIVFQYLKRNMREYAKWKTELPCFIKVDKKRSDLPDWTKETFARGEDIYEFDAANVPDDFRSNLILVRDYLRAVAAEYVERQCQKSDLSNGTEKLVIEYDYFKKDETYKDFDRVLNRARKWKRYNTIVDSQNRVNAEARNRYDNGTANASDINLILSTWSGGRGQKAVDVPDSNWDLVGSFRNQAALVLRRDTEAHASINMTNDVDLSKLEYSPEIKEINKKFLQDADHVTSNAEFNNLLRNRHLAIEKAIMKQIGGQQAILEFAQARKKQYLDVVADMLKDEQNGALYADILINWGQKTKNDAEKQQKFEEHKKFFDDFIKRAYPDVQHRPEIIFGAEENSSSTKDRVIRVGNKTKNIRINLFGNRRTIRPNGNFNDAALVIFHELEHNLISYNPELTIFKGKENLVADTIIQDPIYHIDGLNYGGFVTYDSPDGQKILSVNKKSEIDKHVKNSWAIKTNPEFDYRFLNPNENMAHRVGEIAGDKFLENLNNKLLSEYKDDNSMPVGVEKFLQFMKINAIRKATELLKAKKNQTHNINATMLLQQTDNLND